MNDTGNDLGETPVPARLLNYNLRYCLFSVHQHLFVTAKQSFPFNTEYLKGCQTLFDPDALRKDKSKAISPRLGQMINIKADLLSRNQ